MSFARYSHPELDERGRLQGDLLSERPPALSPEPVPHGDADDSHHEIGAALAPAPPRGGPSFGEGLDAFDVHLRLAGIKFLEVSAARGLVRPDVGKTIMRVPVSDLVLEVTSLLAVVMDLQRSLGRRAPKP